MEAKTNNDQTYILQLLTRANEIESNLVSKMKDFKNTPGLQKQLKQLTKTLTEAQNSQYKNQAFFSNLTEVASILDDITRIMTKYIGTNVLKRKFIAQNVRHKLKSLEYYLNFQIRLIDSIYVNPPFAEEFDLSNSGVEGKNARLKQQEEMRNMEQMFKNRLNDMEKQLKMLKKSGLDQQKR